MKFHPKPRVDVIHMLAEEALKSMDGSGVEDLTAAEVASACFTMTSRVCKVLLEECASEDLNQNIDQIQNAIGGLFALLPDRTKH